MEVVFYEIFSEEEKKLRQHLPKNIRADFRHDTIQSYPSAEPPTPIISIRTQSIIPKQWYSKLEGVLTRSSGYDHLRSILSESQRDVPCGYLPDYCARSVAEHALLVTLALLKKLKKQLKHFETFNRHELTGNDCLNRNVLVVGVGKVGSQIAKLAKGVGMNVKGVDLVQNDPSIEYVSLEEGISSANIVICALPLTEKTERFLDYDKLRQLNKGAIFVNISRGEITLAFRQVLSEGILEGLALDVYEEESKLAAFLQEGIEFQSDYQNLILSLKDRENVIFTPHNAFNSLGGLERKAEESCLALKTFCETGRFPEAVPENFVKF